MPKAACLKRPCKICRRWFSPNPRLGDRQKTCACPECKSEWHRRQCAKWNQANKEYFKANYLGKKLAQCSQPASDGRSDSSPEAQRLPATRIQLHLPRSDIASEITAKSLIAIEYIIAQVIARIHSVKKVTIAGTGSRKLSAMNNSP